MRWLEISNEKMMNEDDDVFVPYHRLAIFARGWYDGVPGTRTQSSRGVILFFVTHVQSVLGTWWGIAARTECFHSRRSAVRKQHHLMYASVQYSTVCPRLLLFSIVVSACWLAPWKFVNIIWECCTNNGVWSCVFRIKKFFKVFK